MVEYEFLSMQDAEMVMYVLENHHMHKLHSPSGPHNMGSLMQEFW